MLNAPDAAAARIEILKAEAKVSLDTLVDQLKDVLSVAWSDKARAALISIIEGLETIVGPVTLDELDEIEKQVGAILGKDLAEAVKQPVVDISKAAYLMGINEVGKALGTHVMWNLPDTKSLRVLNDNTLFWIGEYYSDNVQESLKATMQDYFMGGYNRKELATLMRVHFKDLVNKPKAYWDLLADHICTKTREIGRVSGYEKAGIEYVQFRAHLDEKTTAICRAMHRRIIPVSSMRDHVDRYLKACETQNKVKIKASWPWISDSDAKKIAWEPVDTLVKKNVVMPPLHARCRSITVAYFGDADFIDEFGREYQLPLDIRSKIQRWHLKNVKYKDVDSYVKDCLSNINKEASHINDRSKSILFCKNKHVLFVDANGKIETCFKPDGDAYSYFKKWNDKTFYDSVGWFIKWLKNIF